MVPVPAHGEARCGHRGGCCDRITLDAGDLHESTDRVARETEVMLHRDLGGVLDLPVRTAHDGGQAAGRHRTGGADFGLASALRT
ncbi:hypothetical protein DC31_02980 [Microbacterium sp. CH12i]|nr:hypothetical protein DC31_02980 [Microbacterium sp. CH12i]